MSSMPGSVSITTGCGMRDAGCGRSGTGYRLGTSHFVCNSRAQGRELFRPAEAEDALDGAAAAVEQQRVGEAAVVVRLLHPPRAHEDRERRPERPDEAPHLAEIHVVRDRDDREVSPAELPVQLGHVRELLAAGVAPRRPE